jgi:hypothetical protein
MKLYEVREESQPCSSWHVTKAEALQTLKDVRKEKPDAEIKMDTWDIDNTRKGIVEMLNQLAFRELFHPDHDNPETPNVCSVHDAPETCTVNRVPPPSYTKGETAEQPPPSMSPKVIDQLEAWGLGELAKKCSATREWLDDKEAEPPSVNPDTGEHDDAGRSAFDGAGGECILCGGTYSGWGHNPEPVVPLEKGRCCGVCNTLSVIPARLAMLGARNKA